MSGLGCSQCRLGGKHLVVERAELFQRASGSGRTFQMSDVRLRRPKRHTVRRQVRLAERVGHALGFDHVADARRGAVAFDQGAHHWRYASVLPGTLDPGPLAMGSGAVIPSLFHRWSRPDAAQHHIEVFVMITFSVGEPLSRKWLRLRPSREPCTPSA